MLEASCVRPPGVEEPHRRAELLGFRQGRRQARAEVEARAEVDAGEICGQRCGRRRDAEPRTELRTTARCGAADGAVDDGEGDPERQAAGGAAEETPAEVPAAARESRDGAGKGNCRAGAGKRVRRLQLLELCHARTQSTPLILTLMGRLKVGRVLPSLYILAQLVVQ
jgi:hypothetical protein